MAAGGTVAVSVSDTKAEASVGDASEITSNLGAIHVTAKNDELVLSILGSVSAASAAASGAGTLNVLVTNAQALATVGNAAKLIAQNAVNIKASGESKLIGILLAAAATTGNDPALGATILINVFNRSNIASIGRDATVISRADNVIVDAFGDEKAIMVGIAGSFSEGLSLSGNVQVNVGRSTVQATVGDSTTIDAYDSIGVSADLDSLAVLIAANASLSTGSASIGATIITTVLNNTVLALIGQQAKLIARTSKSGGIKSRKRNGKRGGVVVHARADEVSVMLGISAVGSGGPAAVSGVIDTLVTTTKVMAKVGTTVSGAEDDGGEDGEDEDPDPDSTITSSGAVVVEAIGDTFALNFGGAAAISTGTAGVGATVVSLIFDKTVTASLIGTVTADNVTVDAKSVDDLVLIGVTFGIAAGTAAVSLGGNVLVFQNKVGSVLGGDITATGDVSVLADSDSLLINFAASLGVGNTVGVGGAAVITYFKGETIAKLLSGCKVNAVGNLNVQALSEELVTADCAGISGGGTAGVSGTVDVIVTKVITQAIAEDSEENAGGSLKAASINIEAMDDYMLVAVAVSAALGGTAGVGVTAMVTVAKNTVTSGIGDYFDVETTVGDVNVSALSDREVRTYAGSVAAGGTAGVGVTLMVTVVGGKMSDDVSESLFEHFDPDALFNGKDGQRGMKQNAPSVTDGYFSSDTLNEDLASDGSRISETQVGHSVQRKDSDGNPIQRKDFDGNLLYLDADGNETTTVTDTPSMETEIVYDGAEDYRSDDFNSQAGTQVRRKDAEGNDLYLDANGNETTHSHDAVGNANEPAYETSYDDYEPGANHEVGANADRDNAAAIANSRPAYSPMDATTAYIGHYTVVTSAGNINVTAYDNVVADHVTVSAGVGGTAGVGVGVAVAVIFGNVRAYVEDGAVLSAEDDVNISARSGSTAVEAAEGQNDLLQDCTKNENGQSYSFADMLLSIRTVSISAGVGGTAGVGVAIGSTSLISFTEAYLAGNVIKADDVTGKAYSEYPYVISGTLAIAGGTAGVAASISIVTISGETFAGIIDNARLSSVQNVNVLTDAKTGALSMNGAASVGGVGVNGLISVVVNRAIVESMIGQGVSITAGGAVKVAGNVDTDADAILVSASAGGVAVGLSVAVVILDSDVLTYAGIPPENSRKAKAGVIPSAPSRPINYRLRAT